ncbi:MAG TPA: carboxypeptidase-like regulatory domain-containing protein, partial [Terriglobales bacterium]|nr:carboxypeptidase-like regulatory domain-containing protein [Terriglobales bacterium]
MKKLHLASSACTCCAAKTLSNNSTKTGEPRCGGGLVTLSRLITTVVLALVLFGFCGRLAGQAVNATLLGTVSDSSGAVVVGARGTITEMNTGFRRSAATNDSGNYEFAHLPPGHYEIAVDHEGFRRAVRGGVDVIVNSDVRVDLALQPGATTETATVSAETPILQTERADTGRKIEERQVEDLPLAYNRNFQGLLNLVPGTTRAHREHSSFFNAQDSLRTEVNGQSGLANNLQFEGVDDNERTGLLQVYIPPIEAIQTVDVTTSSYDAELGQADGAVTNVILKTGTNQFHGAAYEINRLSALAAVPYFQNTAVTPKANSVYNYYGANIGGPIVKNKTFFFADILRVDDHQGQFF